MRAVIFIVIVAVLVLLVALATGFLHVDQTRPARAPTVTTSGKGVTAKGGQTPAFDVQTGSVQVGSSKTTVKVPNIQVRPPDDSVSNQTAGNTGNGT